MVIQSEESTVQQNFFWRVLSLGLPTLVH